jgi:hypothetical protein
VQVIEKRDNKFGMSHLLFGHAAGGEVIEALRYKPEGRGFDS